MDRDTDRPHAVHVPPVPDGPPPVPPIVFDAERAAAELRALTQWVLWRFEYRKSKDGDWELTKVPVSAATGRNAKSDDPATWSTFEAAVAAAQRSNGRLGIGFVFTSNDPFCGVDFDNCVVDGVMNSTAAEWIDRFASYVETSPSGKGVKIFVQAKKPEGAKCKVKNVCGCKAVEVYDRERFFTFTGNQLPGSMSHVAEAQATIDALCAELWPPKSKSQRGAANTTSVAAGFGGNDDELLERMFSSKNGDKVRALFNGDTSAHADDDSAADLALCCHLAFWTGKDTARMDRIFRTSRLYRDKWERSEYREATINKAIESTSEVYSPNLPRVSLAAGLPSICLDVDEHRVTDEVIVALEADPEMYHRGNVLVRVLRDQGHGTSIHGDESQPTIADVAPATLRERITKHASLLRQDKNGNWKPSHPPDWLVGQVAARGWWPGLRHLAGISDCPVLRPDGSVCQSKGYDPVTGVLYLPKTTFPSIPDEISLATAIKARDQLLEVVCDFNFESDAHRAAWLAGLLTAMSRHAFAGPAPLFLIDANIRGAGKGLLANTISRIAVGRNMPVSTNATDVDETRKRITAIALAGDPLVLLDNVEGKLGNAALDAALTTTRWSDRLLGVNRRVDLPLRPTWFATGNNVLVGADTTRRIVHVRLEVLEERPEHRQGFRHPNLLKWIDERRGELAAAALTIIAGYIRAGKPAMSTATMGSFEGWSDLIPQAVMWVGLPDPRETQRTLQTFSDDSEQQLRDLHDAFAAYVNPRDGVVVADLIEALYGGQPRQTKAAVMMRSALEAITDTKVGTTPTARQVGNKFRAFRKRVIDGRYLDINSGIKTRGGVVWWLVSTGDERGSHTRSHGVDGETGEPIPV